MRDPDRYLFKLRAVDGAVANDLAVQLDDVFVLRVFRAVPAVLLGRLRDDGIRESARRKPHDVERLGGQDRCFVKILVPVLPHL